MARRPRVALGGLAYHVMNRVAGRQELFEDEADCPVHRPRGWLRTVNLPQHQRELDRLRSCIRRGRPYGDDAWVRRTAAKLGLESTLRPVGRPKKAIKT